MPKKEIRHVRVGVMKQREPSFNLVNRHQSPCSPETKKQKKNSSAGGQNQGRENTISYPQLLGSYRDRELFLILKKLAAFGNLTCHRGRLIRRARAKITSQPTIHEEKCSLSTAGERFITISLFIL